MWYYNWTVNYCSSWVCADWQHNKWWSEEFPEWFCRRDHVSAGNHQARGGHSNVWRSEMERRGSRVLRYVIFKVLLITCEIDKNALWRWFIQCSLTLRLLVFLYSEPYQVHSCDFESSAFCGWIQDTYTDDFDWTRHIGETTTGRTGPNSDHTLGPHDTTGTSVNIFYIDEKTPLPNSRKISDHLINKMFEHSLIDYMYFKSNLMLL